MVCALHKAFVQFEKSLHEPPALPSHVVRTIWNVPQAEEPATEVRAFGLPELSVTAIHDITFA